MAEHRCQAVLAVICDDHARRLYQRDLVLIRPDQHVACRGDTAPTDPGALIDRVRGAMSPVSSALTVKA